jgi:hypothetical protein
MCDLSDKLEQAESALVRNFLISESQERRPETKLMKATKDCCKTTIECIHGLMAQMIKQQLFNHNMKHVETEDSVMA